MLRAGESTKVLFNGSLEAGLELSGLGSGLKGVLMGGLSRSSELSGKTGTRLTGVGIEMNVLGDVDSLSDGTSGLSRGLDVVGTGRLVEPELGNELGTLLPAIPGVGRAKKNRLQDLLSLESVADSVLTGSTFRATGLHNIAKVNSFGGNLAVDCAARAEEANAFAASGVTNGTVLSHEVKLCTIKCENWRHLWGALGDGDGLTAHLDDQVKAREGKRKTREGELHRQEMREGR